MGAVYKAIDLRLGREVALKVLLPDQAALKPVLLKRFRLEARFGGRVSHENIVTLYEYGEIHGIHFLALEYVEGINLQELIARKGKLEIEESRKLILQAARAIEHLNQHGIIHRDIKPSNFIVTKRGERPLIKLIDLGLARRASDEEARVTIAGTTLGTVDYLAPEQARDSGAADVRSDIYSLGCTWYHMLAGRPPFAEGSVTERVYKHIGVPPPDIQLFNPKAPDSVKQILLKMLAKEPGDRYQSPQDLLCALEGKAPRQENEPEQETFPQLAAHSQADLLASLAGEEDASAAIRRRRAARRDFLDYERQQEEFRFKPKSEHRRQERKFWAMGAGAIALVLLVVLAMLLLQSPPKPAPGTVVGGNSPQVPSNSPASPSSGSVPDSLPPSPRPEPQAPPEAPTPGPQAQAPESPPPNENRGDAKPPPPLYPSAYPAARNINVSALREEFERPWRNVPAPPAAAHIFHVSRFPTGGTEQQFDSLAAACAAAPAGGETIIEINDSGPLFATPIAITGRKLTLRAAKGYRPLIAWDLPGPATTKTNQLISFAQGSLTIENLDVVVKTTDAKQSAVSTLFKVSDADFRARSCTFSIAGKHARGVVVVGLEGTTTKTKQRCRLDQCYVRGSEAIALEVRTGGAELLLKGCLLVGGRRPLVDILALPGSTATTLGVCRSTLVADRRLLDVRLNAASGPQASFCLRCWDSLLARKGLEPQGEMVALLERTLPGSMQWDATNCLYTGWTTLLATSARQINDLESWHSVWPPNVDNEVADKVLEQVWPAAASHADPAEIPAMDYQTIGTSAYYSATSGPGALGCDTSGLPPTRDAWLRLTYDPPALESLEPPKEAAPIPPTDRRYSGETLDAQVDVGEHLQKMAVMRGLAPKVVLHLRGTGDQFTSPIHIKGSSLVLHFDSTPGTPSLWVMPKERKAVDHDALIEVEDGSLEIAGGGFRLLDFKLAPLPAHLFKVQGDLLLTRCRLEGPMSQVPDQYQGLIQWEGSPRRKRDDPPHHAIMTDCVLASAKSCMAIADTAAHLRMTNCVLIASDDAFAFNLSRSTDRRLDLQCTVEHTTIAARSAAIHLIDGPHVPPPFEPILFMARANVFGAPFADSTRPSSLLAFDDDMLQHGLLAWHGLGNAYEKGLSYISTPSERPVPQMAYAAWAHFWGPAGDLQPIVDISLPHTFDLQRPPLVQLDRMALPKPRQPADRSLSPGADLQRLGGVAKQAGN
jgi:serine/threonine-protein kinase